MAIVYLKSDGTYSSSCTNGVVGTDTVTYDPNVDSIGTCSAGGRRRRKSKKSKKAKKTKKSRKGRKSRKSRKH
jgi:hypothetical protein